MHIKIEREKLLPTLNLVCSVVEKRQTLPILANLYLIYENGTLNIVGTDIEVEISQIIGGIEGDNGSFTVSARKLLDICRMLPGNAVINFKMDNDKVVISSGRSRYTLKVLEANDFPRIEAGNWEERFKIHQNSLKTLLDNTSFAMAVQDVRYYLNGILFEIKSRRLRAIATDGHRLAQSDVEIELDIDDVRQLIVPRKAIAEISRFLDGDGDAELTVEISKNHLKLSKDNTVLITKLIDGKFPEFKGVLETELGIVIQLNRSEFIEMLTRVAVLTTDRFKGVRINLDKNQMMVTANNPEQEEAVEEMVMDYNGDKVETGYNVSYLIDAARVVNGENIEVHLQGNDGICIVRQPNEQNSTWLVMPMRI